MPNEPYPRGTIQRLVERGESATKTLGEFRQAGGSIATQTWYRLWGEIQNELAMKNVELGRPLHLRPSQDEILQMTTKRARGFAQRVQVFGRNPYGDVMTKTIDVRTRAPVARKNAISKAMSIVEGISGTPMRASSSDIVDVLGAVYSGTFELSPG